jgi:hypothetical protein
MARVPAPHAVGCAPVRRDSATSLCSDASSSSWASLLAAEVQSPRPAAAACAWPPSEAAAAAAAAREPAAVRRAATMGSLAPIAVHARATL